MLNSLKFYLNNIEVQPINRAEFNLDFSVGNYLDNSIYVISPTTSIDQSKLVIGDPAEMKIVYNWIADGKAYEGIPLAIYDSITQQFIFSNTDSYCLIAHEDFEIIERRQITLPIIDKRSNFTKQVERLHLKLLQEKKAITKNDWVKIYYILEEDSSSGINGLKTAFLFWQAYSLTKELTNKVSDLVNLGLNAGLIPAGPVVSAAQIAVKIIDLAFTLVALYTSLKQISDALFDKPRYHYGMTFKRIIEIAIDYLGYNLETDLFDTSEAANLVYWKEQETIGSYVGSPNNNGNGTPNMLFSDFLAVFCKLFNAKAKIKNNTTVQIYRIDTFLNETSNVSIPLTRTEQNTPYPTGYNLHELPANIFVKYQRDSSDNNTFSGETYSAQSHTAPQILDNEKFNTHNGLRQIDLGVSLAVRKDSQTVLEKVFNTIWDLLGRLGGRNNFLYGNRIGCAKLSNHTFTVPKVCVVNNGLLTGNSTEYTSARNVLENYLVTDTAKENQQFVYKQVIQIPLTAAEIKSLIDIPIAEDDQTNRRLMIEECQYDTQTALYNLKIRVLKQPIVQLDQTITGD